MKRQILSFTVILAACLWAKAQTQDAGVEVQVLIGDSAYTICKSTTQTETKTPWTVFSFEVGGKTTKYLYGSQSQQLVDQRTPLLIINPQDATLADYALIRLIKKKSRRQLPEPLLRDNPYQSIDLANFVIEMEEDERFAIRPRQPLEAGEYMLLNINQEPHGDMGDYYGYCFTIE